MAFRLTCGCARLPPVVIVGSCRSSHSVAGTRLKYLDSIFRQAGPYRGESAYASAVFALGLRAPWWAKLPKLSKKKKRKAWGG